MYALSSIIATTKITVYSGGLVGWWIGGLVDWWVVIITVLGHVTVFEYYAIKGISNL